MQDVDDMPSTSTAQLAVPFTGTERIEYLDKS